MERELETVVVFQHRDEIGQIAESPGIPDLRCEIGVPAGVAVKRLAADGPGLRGLSLHIIESVVFFAIIRIVETTRSIQELVIVKLVPVDRRIEICRQADAVRFHLATERVEALRDVARERGNARNAEGMGGARRDGTHALAAGQIDAGAAPAETGEAARSGYVVKDGELAGGLIVLGEEKATFVVGGRPALAEIIAVKARGLGIFTQICASLLIENVAKGKVLRTVHVIPQLAAEGHGGEDVAGEGIWFHGQDEATAE